VSGYTPLFSSLTTGTLCGKWPDIGLWPIVLSLCDKHGVVDVTPAYIAGVTGLPLADVVACMKRFCEPDPYSRSGAESGSRLVLVDEHRDWGWRVVNHGSYREKARKQMQQIRATETGRDAERKRIEREGKASGDVQPCPAVSSADRPSYADSDSDSDKSKNKSKTRARARSASEATEFPDDFALDDSMRQQALKLAPDCDVDQTFASFKANHLSRGSKFKNWRQAWTSWLGNFSQYGYPKRQNGAAQSIAEKYPGYRV
jgi:hypothetical protein